MKINWSEIKNEMQRQGIAEQRLAVLTGITQNKIHRLINDEVKKNDYEALAKIQSALGLISEPTVAFGITGIHQAVSPEENDLLKYWRQLGPDHKRSTTEMIRGLLLLENQKGRG